jgi:glycosyltransferase involved in cell wall biosynthesis
MKTAHPTPTISTIMIFLNAEDFIEEAIESVLAQTETDWELLLVDDGSTDGSTSIARRYEQLHPGQIRYLEHPDHQNRGMSASRNRGIDNARGDYIAFLDADDVWLPQRLECHLAVLRGHDEVGMAYSPTLYWYSWSDAATGPDALEDHVGELSLEPGRPVPPPTALLKFLESGGGSVPGICSILARRDVVQRIGGFEESFRGLYEDQVFLSKMCFQSTVFILDEVLDKYRQHPKSHCYQAIETGEYHPVEPHPGRARYLEWLERYLRENKTTDARLMAALNKELWPYRHSWRYALKQNAIFRCAVQAARRSLPPQTYSWLREQFQRVN